MSHSASRGAAESPSAVGAVASPVPAVGVFPVDEVQALLDDLAPACETQCCSAAAVWIAWCVCSCDVGSAEDPTFLCSVDYADVLAGVVGWNVGDEDPHAYCHLVVTRSERIRSKPTK